MCMCVCVYVCVLHVHACVHVCMLHVYVCVCIEEEVQDVLYIAYKLCMPALAAQNSQLPTSDSAAY